MLRIELVPRPLWGKSLRQTLPDADWLRLRGWALERSGYACDVCGIATPNGAGLTGHEDWEYDDARAVQILRGVQIRCRDCAAVTRLGRISTYGVRQTYATALARLQSINGWTTDQVAGHWREALQQWTDRNARTWVQDLDWYERWKASTVAP
jgi:hypothetical protein